MKAITGIVCLLTLVGVIVALPAQAQSQDELMQTLMERSRQYVEAPDPETKMQIAAQTALEFPNLAMAMRDILGAYVENAVDKLGRVEEAHAFLTQKYAPLVTDTEVKQLLEVALLNVYGRYGYGVQFTAQLKQSTTLDRLSTNDLVRIHEWANATGNVKAITQANELLAGRTNLAAVEAEYGNRNYSAEIKQQIIDRRNHRIKLSEAWITALSGDPEAGLADLEELLVVERLDAFGKPSIDFLTLKAGMQALAGNYDAAARTYAWLYDYKGQKLLMDRLKVAWSKGSKADIPFEDFHTILKAEIAPKMPSLKASTASGEVVNIDKMRGKVTLITLWSTTCAKCKVELPVMNEIYARYKGKGFELIALEGNRDHEGTKAFVEQHDLNFPVLFNLEGRDSAGYIMQADSIPANYLVDETGTVVKVHIGYSKGDEQAMEAAIRQHLGL